MLSGITMVKKIPKEVIQLSQRERERGRESCSCVHVRLLWGDCYVVGGVLQPASFCNKEQCGRTRRSLKK